MNPLDDRWMTDAACTNRPDINFFPERGEDPRPAQNVCATCPVATECLQDALGRGALGDIGIWGGTTGEDRRRIRRGLRTGAPTNQTRPNPDGTCPWTTPVSTNGANKHLRRGETPCDPCSAERNRYNRERWAKANAA